MLVTVTMFSAPGSPGPAERVDHVAGGELGQEVGALEVDRHQAVEALLAGLQDVRPHAGGHPGVVDQQVEAAEARGDGVDQALAVGGGGDVPADDLGADAVPGSRAAATHGRRRLRAAASLAA